MPQPEPIDAPHFGHVEGVRLAVLLEVRELGKIARAFRIEMDGAALERDSPCKRGLADLTRPDEDDRGISIQQTVELGLPIPFDQARRSDTKYANCMVAPSREA